MSDPGREHWLDRLAAPRTRREVLQAALAGAVLTLPFARPAAVHAASQHRTARKSGCKLGPSSDPKACQKGCFATSNLKADRGLDRCAGQIVLTNLSAISVLGPMGILPYLGTLGASAIGDVACSEAVLLRQKAMQYDCLQPNCPGFDPCGPGGPCAGLPPNVFCCPDPSTWNGYVPCSECCSPKGNGCGSGTTECGGNP